MTLNPMVPGVIDISATYIIFGILFGLINALIRPLVLLFTAKLVLRTMGLFSIVINTLLLALLSWIAGDVFVVDSPQIDLYTGTVNNYDHERPDGATIWILR